jgi:hypothetical protein
MVEELLGFTLELAIPTEFSRGAIKEAEISGLIYFLKKGTVISKATVEAKAPEAISSGICLIGFLRVTPVVSLDRINDADTNFSNQVVYRV